MNAPDIIFPHLGIKIAHLGRNISIGNFTIAYYGILIAIGMLLGVTLIMKLAERDGDNSENYMDMALITLVLGVIGARIYYVIFRWDSYKDTPLQILNLRGGGLAIYGGILVGIVSVVVFCRIKKMNLLKTMDNCIFGVALGQGIGRWGNFFNCEAFGGNTDSLFAMQIKSSLVNTYILNHSLETTMVDGTEYVSVHPTFFYESVLCFCIVGLLFLMHKYKRVDGMCISLYFILYGCGRFFIEGLRTDQLQIGSTGIAVSQIVSVGLVLAGIAIIVWRNLAATKNPELLVANRKAREKAAETNADENRNTQDGASDDSSDPTLQENTDMEQTKNEKKSWRK